MNRPDSGPPLQPPPTGLSEENRRRLTEPAPRIEPGPAVVVLLTSGDRLTIPGAEGWLENQDGTAEVILQTVDGGKVTESTSVVSVAAGQWQAVWRQDKTLHAERRRI